MLSNIDRVIRPKSVDEALRILRDEGGAARAMAGGTAGSLFRSSDIRAIVDLWSLPTRYVRTVDAQLSIGATATLGDLVRSPEVREWAGGALWEAARSAASTPLRNLITAGGNLAALYPWSNLPPALLALDARVRIAGEAGPELGIDELVSHHPLKVLGPDSLITEIRVPDYARGEASAFMKFGLSRVDYTWLDVAALVRMEGSACQRCRLAVGGVEPRCRRLREVEELVEGCTLDEELASRAGELAASVVEPIHDSRCSEQYKRQLVRTQCARVLLEARNRAAGGA